MGILADHQIRLLGAIAPYAPAGSTPPGRISAGESAYGYDLTLGAEFRLFRQARGGVVDPKAFDAALLESHAGDRCVIPPHGFALGVTVETVCLPRDCVGLVVDKSTYRRCGILMGATVIEPEWEGRITLEITNATPLPAVVYAGEGVAQLLIFRADAAPCEVSYADRRGKYHGDRGLTLPKIFAAGGSG